MERGIEGQVIVITGASSGLGEQAARCLDAAGARLVLAARRADRLEAVAASLSVEAVTVECDVTLDADRTRLIEAAIDAHGRIDGLLNNAGIMSTGPALKEPVSRFSEILGTNLVAPFALSCLAAERMRATGGGAIVNMSSTAAFRSADAFPQAAYVASKAGLAALTRELASQWGRYEIRVNALAPGFFMSELVPPEYEELAVTAWLSASVPLSRAGREGELNAALLFLFDRGASFVTGQVVAVDGGMTTR
jgi:NAD(P)-dependent dehydrogenase (short-subunit alcohol dehydrogenase family)